MARQMTDVQHDRLLERLPLGLRRSYERFVIARARCGKPQPPAMQSLRTWIGGMTRAEARAFLAATATK